MQPPRYAEYAGDIHRSGKRLLSLVDDLLDLAKVEAGRVRLELAELDARTEAEAAAQALATEAAKAGVAIVVERARVPLRADSRALRQMLLNLLSNAIKFTPAEGAIRVGFEQGPKDVVIAVADSGVGVASDEIARLMEPFTQGDAALILGQKGTGLGLAITRSLMELHGGRLELESAPGAGLTARLVFPNPKAPARLAA